MDPRPPPESAAWSWLISWVASINRVFGIGPYVDVALGHYTSFNYDTGSSRGSLNIENDERRTHGWLTLGARFVFFP